MKYNIAIKYLFVFVIGVLISCKSEIKQSTTPEDLSKFKGKYVKNIERNTIFFEDGDQYKINEKKYLKTFVLIRHAEKDTTDKSGDPPLTEEGLKRGAKLADIFSDFRIDAVYSTITTRTLYTVDSLCDIKSLPTLPYENKDLKGLVEKVRNSLNEHNVLIVGHSNTIPVLTNYLYGEQVYNQIFDENDYDNIIFIFENIDKSKILLPLKYRQE
jgi:2,3-bisphosphoglycerate-dependent phosphoglycerate mutase